MSFPYNPNIPNPPNDPADDVSLMQQNAGSISGLIAVDHVGFGMTGAGQHNQVTFNANKVPSVFPVTPPVLFTNTVAGLSQLFFYSGAASRSSSQYYNSAANGNAVQGSAVLLGGIIIKWGTYVINNGNFSTAVTFANLSGAQPFPNNLFSISVTCTAFSVSNDILCTAVNPVAGGFSGQRIGSPGTQASYAFIAIGN